MTSINRVTSYTGSKKEALLNTLDYGKTLFWESQIETPLIFWLNEKFSKAWKNNLKIRDGDRLLAIDDIDVTDISYEEVIQILDRVR